MESGTQEGEIDGNAAIDEMDARCPRGTGRLHAVACKGVPYKRCNGRVRKERTDTLHKAEMEWVYEVFGMIRDQNGVVLPTHPLYTGTRHVCY